MKHYEDLASELKTQETHWWSYEVLSCIKNWTKVVWLKELYISKIINPHSFLLGTKLILNNNINYL